MVLCMLGQNNLYVKKDKYVSFVSIFKFWWYGIVFWKTYFLIDLEFYGNRNVGCIFVAITNLASKSGFGDMGHCAKHNCYQFPHRIGNLLNACLSWHLIPAYGVGDLGQQLFRKWLVCWRQQAITWTDIDYHQRSLAFMAG